MKNPIGSIANTKSHGTNPNYAKSGPPILGGLKKMAGNFVKGKGAFGLLNPMGAIASRMGAFGKKAADGGPAQQPVPATPTPEQATAAPAPAAPVPPVDETAETPMAKKTKKY